MGQWQTVRATVPMDVAQAAIEKAKADDRSLSDVVGILLTGYAGTRKSRKPRKPVGVDKARESEPGGSSSTGTLTETVTEK